MISNYWLLSKMSAEKWAKNINHKMKEYFKKKFGGRINASEIDVRDIIRKKSTVIQWLRPAMRSKFLDIFVGKKAQEGYFTGQQWKEIGHLLDSVGNQKEKSKVGFNSLKLASQRLRIKYWRARQYFRTIRQKGMIRQYSLGGKIPKFNQKHRDDRIKFAKAIVDGTIPLDEIIVTDESTVQNVPNLRGKKCWSDIKPENFECSTGKSWSLMF